MMCFGFAMRLTLTRTGSGKSDLATDRVDADSIDPTDRTVAEHAIEYEYEYEYRDAEYEYEERRIGEA